jgi:transcriptional antiterminator NusG
MSDQNTDPNTEEEKKDQAAAPEASKDTTDGVSEEAPATTDASIETESTTANEAKEEETPEAAPEEQAEPASEENAGKDAIDGVSEEDASEDSNDEVSEEDAGKEAIDGDSEEKEIMEGSSLLMREKKTALKTSVGKQAMNTGRNWYVIHTYSGYEDAVEKALRQRIESLNMHDLIFDIIVPKESTITIKKGEHVTEKKRLFPGYVLVEMIVTDESWYVVRNTPNVTGFVGSGTIPVPVHPEEFNVIQKHIKKEEPKFKINFQIGEQVTISDGPFKTYEGLIDTIDEKKGKLKVLVTIFGRETPVELDFVQVKKK